MKQLLLHISLAFIATMFFWSSSYGQNGYFPDSLQELKLINTARKIMTSVSTCALISLDENGKPMVRAMDAFHPEEDFTVWMGTNPLSRKVEQIRKNPNVSLYYLENDESGYVVLHGRAELVNDEDEKKKRWKDEWDAFYEDKDKDYLLIKVIAKSLEVVSYSNGIVSTSENWEVPNVVFD